MLKTVFRTAALSAGLVCSGAFAPGAVAQPLDEVAAGQDVSENVTDIAGWVLATDNNRGLPFAVVDKNAAQILIFDAEGKLKGLAPVLLGSAAGDGSAPGVGDRELKDIPAEDRTTPAGRFLVGYGPATGGKTVLWVDVLPDSMPMEFAFPGFEHQVQLVSSAEDPTTVSLLGP